MLTTVKPQYPNCIVRGCIALPPFFCMNSHDENTYHLARQGFLTDPCSSHVFKGCMKSHPVIANQHDLRPHDGILHTEALIKANTLQLNHNLYERDMLNMKQWCCNTGNSRSRQVGVGLAECRTVHTVSWQMDIWATVRSLDECSVLPLQSHYWYKLLGIRLFAQTYCLGEAIRR